MIASTWHGVVPAAKADRHGVPRPVRTGALCYNPASAAAAAAPPQESIGCRIR